MMQLTDEQAMMMGEWIIGMEGGEPEDYVELIDQTADEFSRYDLANWTEGEVEDETTLADGSPARAFRNVRVAKGSPRVNLYVVDFGAFRAVYQI